MLKKFGISLLFKVLIGAIVLGIGIWYLSSSIGGASLSYTSMDYFLHQIGADSGDISSINGCFLCKYMEDLFGVIGNATEMFWNGIVHNLWILMAVGFGIFLILHSVNYLKEQTENKDLKELNDTEPKLDFNKWFDKVWKTGVRIMIAGVVIGALNWTGTNSLRMVTNVTVAPVMYLGTTLSMAATNEISNTKCEMLSDTDTDNDILNPVLRPFMCVMGNLNTVMLAGAAGGFAMMNYSWLDMGGGAFTWLAGLALVILFLVMGFDLLFQILTVIMKLVFIIIFMPLLIAAVAFEQVWGVAKNFLNSSIEILFKSAISILKITLKICIIYAIIFFSADAYFPEPQDNFTAILPPLMGETSISNTDAKTLSVMNVFKTCEQVAIGNNGDMDKMKFKNCFNAQRAMVEHKYPGAFKFLDDGFEFFIFMIGIFFLYFWIVSPKIDDLLNSSKEGKETFDYGEWLKSVGKTTFDAPEKIYKSVKKVLDK